MKDYVLEMYTGVSKLYEMSQWQEGDLLCWEPLTLAPTMLVDAEISCSQ
jgi:hypothetical protein